MSRACRGENLVLSGKGNRKQTYVHVRDISKALLQAIESEKAHGVYNLSSNNCLSNRELAEKCVELLHSDSRIVFSGKEDPSDDYVWDVSLKKIYADIGYVPEVTIEEAILEYAKAVK